MRTDDVILVHTMGRVGSTTVQRSIEERLGRPVPHTHALNPTTLARQVLRWGSVASVPQSVEAGLHANLLALRSSARIQIITLTRDPVDRNLSAMFAALSAEHSTASLEAVLRDGDLVRRGWERAHHARPSTWFDQELRDPLGLDVFAYPFSASGIQVLEDDRVRLLILRSELPDDAKSSALGEFLHVDSVPLHRRNDEARRGELAQHYARWRSLVGPETDYVRHQRSTRYYQHFYETKADS